MRHSLMAVKVLYLSAGQCFHIYKVCDSVRFLEQATPKFILPDQTAPTSTRWTTLSVHGPRYPNSGVRDLRYCPTSCLPVQNVDELKQCLVDAWYIMEQNITAQCVSFSNVCISQGSVATCLRCGGNFMPSF